MKKIITLLVLSLLIVSCGRSEEEQMLYDYKAKGIKDFLNIDLKDMDFKILSIKKVGEVTAKDSLDILKPYFEGKKNNKIAMLKEMLAIPRFFLVKD